MPGFDGTGPKGLGPKTGRGFGPCGLGLGWRKRFGTGRGLGRYFNWAWPQNQADQKQALTEYKKALEEELEDVGKEEKELEE
ncbi:MAG: DUF5320 domain-containing protein [Candidatus Shapirobacteria bacterium]|nr:DUF5320 domain-containing protein [Candidatus Shapirobacteria bacterium]MDD5073582.1 DUF5320 domain-containing protein [Candidatus Shapirobacteria bacterium]MDD5481335.1 DUF5320 domain-containing protein [Candidatus Shapirobacteria bacterium]